MSRKFEVGDLVVIVAGYEYKGKYRDMTGKVEQCFNRSHNHFMYGVRVDNHTNLSSSKGLFWFEARSLNHQPNNLLTSESEEIPMFENFIVAKVQFLDNPVPVFSYALYDADIVEGDTVVVQTGSHGFSLAKIHEIVPNSAEGFAEAKKQVTKGRQVVCKVDFSAYNARQEALRRANELKRSMDVKLREAQTMAIYEMFAEKDPELKVMLDEFKTLHYAIKGETNGEETH